MSSTFTKISQVAITGAREIGVPGPSYRNDYPYRFDREQGITGGMGHRGAGRGEERRYWVKLLDGRSFEGTNPVAAGKLTLAAQLLGERL